MIDLRPRHELPADLRPLRRAIEALDLDLLGGGARAELEMMMASVQQSLLGYPTGWTPAPAELRPCPRIVAGLRCLVSVRYGALPSPGAESCPCQRGRGLGILDHARLWLVPRGGYALSSEPYGFDVLGAARYADACGELGLDVRVSARSPYYPLESVLVITTRRVGEVGKLESAPMAPDAFRALRECLGARKAAALVLGCSVGEIRGWEGGRHPVPADAARRLLEAVHGARRRAGGAEPRRAPAAMTAEDFQACVQTLDWMTRATVALRLLGDERDVGTVTRWVTGAARIPEWVARDLRAALGLRPHEPWPTSGEGPEAAPPEFAEDL